MRLPFRKKDKKSSLSGEIPEEFRPEGAGQPPLFPPTHKSAFLLAHLSQTILKRIFVAVCPHAQDESYATCEESASESRCMLCDMRDLAHCGQVNRAWRVAAVQVLYHSVRIDPVHYCKLEAWLAERRKKTSRFEKNGVPEDAAQARLRLLRRTVRDDPTRVGKLVQYLKIPYMIREFCYVELAQTIAVLPNLHYVDLPEGMFADEQAYATLRLEVQARCPNIRKTSFRTGAERSFSKLATGRVWPHLRVLELKKLELDSMTLRNALSSLPELRALKASSIPGLTNEVFFMNDQIPSLPALEELVLKDIPGVTASGLVDYLAWITAAKELKVLTLKETGVHPEELHEVVTAAAALRSLAFQTRIAEAWPNNTGLPFLQSSSIRTLRFEVCGLTASAQHASAVSSHYYYLASSILAAKLPLLRRLYVLDEAFPDKLQQLPAPNAAFAGSHGHSRSISSSRGAPTLRISPASPNPNVPAPMPSPGIRSPGLRSPQSLRAGTTPNNRLSSNNPYAPRTAIAPPPVQTLEIFTKSDEFGQWNFARVDALNNAAPQSNRPSSSYGLPSADVEGQGWDRGAARMSVMVGNGADGFLALPGQLPGNFPVPPLIVDDANGMRPRSSSGNSRFGRI